ncbi:MAG: GntR family transcriptional regulator [Gammaproteobacteria bacterium]|nr:GntR family transcriptional regulator [Gammaproteobacteria bacterium]MCZ6856112.1 GntR family transcriptional regulator [Gammaproteobacteria bacterium]
MKKHDEIADGLTHDILVGQYRTGERLPSERDLAARFDANRGAVREAMKKLEQLGIADIQPGGARVLPLTEASLDVVGHLLAVGELPDAKLVDQILEVISSLISLAAESTLSKANGEEIERIRDLVKPLYLESLNEEAHMAARVSLMSAIMEASGNLVCHIIARSLLQQFAPNMTQLKGFAHVDVEAYRSYARQLDKALGARDKDAVRTIFEAFSKLNRESVMRAFAAFQANGNGSADPEVSTS